MKIWLFVLIVSIVLAVITLTHKTERLEFVEKSPTSDYTVEVYSAVSVLDFDWMQSRWDRSTVVYVKNWEGQTLKVMRPGPLGMCDVIWSKDGVVVGSSSYSFGDNVEH